MNNSLALPAALLVVLVLVMTVACREAPTLTTRVETRPAFTLDPAHARNKSELRSAALLFLPLIGTDGPGIGEDWSLGPENKSLVLVLRDIAFSDGTRITASLVRESLLRFLAPETGSPHTYLLTEFVAGAREFSLGLADDNAVGIEVVDRQTLRFDFLVSVPRPEQVLAHPSLAPVPLHHVADMRTGAVDGGDPWWAAAEVPTSGPFVPAGEEWLQTYSEGLLSLSLVQNEYFDLVFDRERPVRTTEQMRIEFMNQTAALETAGRQEVEEVLGLAGPGIPEGLAVTRRCLPVMEMLLFSVREGIAADTTVRRAIAATAVHALDPVLQGEAAGGRPTLLPWPTPATPCEQSEVTSLFGAAPTGTAWEGALRVLLPEYGEAADVASDDVLVDALRNLGDVEAIRLPFADYAYALRRGDFDVARVRWHGGADAFYAAFTSFSGRNDAEFHNDEYDRQYRAAAVSALPTWQEFTNWADAFLIYRHVVVVPLARSVVYDYSAR